MKGTLAAVALLVLAATACGGGDQALSLSKAAERTEAQGSGRFEIGGTQKMDDERVEYACTGEADYVGERVHVHCEYVEAGELEAIAIENDFYVRGILVGDTGGKWVKMSGDVDEDTSLATLSPEKLLRLLRDASSDTEHIGDEQIRGDSTVGYRLTVDCEAAELRCKSMAPVEVWVGGDGVVRRIVLDDDNGTATFEFFDFGADVDIQAPPGDQVTEDGIGSVGLDPAVPCTDDEAMPISEDAALDALRRHGFGMRSEAAGCGSLLNVKPGGNASNVLRTEGIVHCNVYQRPWEGAPSTVVRRGADGADAELVLKNLECTILADSPDAEAKIDPLEAAFEELQRAIRP